MKINPLIVKCGAAHIINSRVMYNRLKENKYAKDRTTLLGRRGLRHIISFLLLLSVAIVSLFAMIDSFAQLKIFVGVLLLVVMIMALAYGVLFIPLSINLTVKQLKLNKRAIGWIDLVLLIIGIIAVVVLFVVIKNS